MNKELDEKPVVWIGTSREGVRRFPAEVKDVMGYALYLAQTGSKHSAAKPLKGFGGAKVLEIIDNYKGNTYRVMYTVKFTGVAYVLHAFQKKSRRGAATPKPDIDLIRQRLRRAEEYHREHYR